MINLARHEPDPATIEEITRLATDELSEAGIEPLALPAALRLGEVPSRVIGALHGWTFERAWCYWRAEGPGLPAEAADRLHAAHGSEVRVNGDCCAPSPREVFHGLGVGRYHVDSQAGLNALAATLRSVVEAADAPPSGVDRGADGWHYLPELPAAAGPYLVAERGWAEIARAWWWRDGFRFDPDDSPLDDVYAWCPAPAPPPLPEAKP